MLQIEIETVWRFRQEGSPQTIGCWHSQRDQNTANPSAATRTQFPTARLEPSQQWRISGAPLSKPAGKGWC
jgi:hypothetical protein